MSRARRAVESMGIDALTALPTATQGCSRAGSGKGQWSLPTCIPPDSSLCCPTVTHSTNSSKYSTYPSKGQVEKYPLLWEMIYQFFFPPTFLTLFLKWQKTKVTASCIFYKYPLNSAAGCGCPQSTLNFRPEPIPTGTFPFVQHWMDWDRQEKATASWSCFPSSSTKSQPNNPFISP